MPMVVQQWSEQDYLASQASCPVKVKGLDNCYASG